MSKGWGPDPCWGCGSVGDHPTLGGHYWPCGTMKCASIRGEQCYETEITHLKGLVREMGQILKYYADYYGPNRSREILSRPEVREIMEVE